ncbi:MAG: sulfotransferase domain-containing protein [Flavobacteriales bacterium]|nr:sulfotransferase domain-containing protein [Flavobacteriales bacterium]
MKVGHIIIGAGRSGTTSLVAYLKQHSDVNFSSIKEVTYFSVDDHYRRGEEFLHSFYSTDSGCLATSDTYLLMSREAPKRIQAYNPKMKLTVILREPGDRSYSNYHFSVNQGYIDPDVSFIQSEAKEQEMLKTGDVIAQNNHGNFYGSLYHKHLAYWLQYFDRKQLFICTTKQLKEDPEGLMLAYFRFLGLSPIEPEPLEAQHAAAAVKSKRLNRFLVNRDHWLRRVVRKPLQIGFVRRAVIGSNVVDKIKAKNREELSYPPMTKEERQFCNDYFKADLAALKQDFGIEFNGH